MGYTHYWTLPATHARTFANLARLAKAAWVASPIRVAFEYDQPDKQPVFNSKRIRFNGVGDNGHETFSLTFGDNERQFCKTAQKPYDELVVAILILAAKNLPGFSWSSYGDPVDHRDGLALAQQVDDSITETGCPAD